MFGWRPSAHFSAPRHGPNDIVIGTYASNRKRSELQRIFGDFSNLVTLRFRGAAGKSFRGWVSATRDVLISATAYSEVPYEELRRSFAAAGGALPEIRTIFLSAPPERPLQFAGLKVALEDPPSFRGMPWGFTFILLPSRRECQFAFDASRYDPVAVRAAAGRWQRFADLLARRPDVPMEQLTQQALARGAEKGALILMTPMSPNGMPRSCSCSCETRIAPNSAPKERVPCPVNRRHPRLQP